MSIIKNKLIPSIAVGALSSRLEVGTDRASHAAGQAAEILAELGMTVENLGSIDTPQKAVSARISVSQKRVDAIVLVAVSWFEDYLVLDLLEECSRPLLLWSLPGMETGALCGVQQLTAYLKHLEVPYGCIYSQLESVESQQKAKDFLLGTALKSRLRRTKIGLDGYHVRGMTEVSVNEFALKKQLGLGL
ncbi:MAG TPA: hypothetical protein PLK08_01300 [Phycisphaerae bacterium]|nr:hypothetical protein [Phycisphaerae bacterium]